MKIVPEPIAFEWDKGNIEKNLLKHNVTPQEAEEMFSAEPFIARDDQRHSTVIQKRFQALGKTKKNRKLFVTFTIVDHKIRVISIRDMTIKEEVVYEKLENNS